MSTRLCELNKQELISLKRKVIIYLSAYSPITRKIVSVCGLKISTFNVIGVELLVTRIKPSTSHSF